MNENTNFAGARTATAQSALDLYGTTEQQAVESAWCAVGVGQCPTGGGGGGNTGDDNELENNVAKTGLSASSGEEITFHYGCSCWCNRY